MSEFSPYVQFYHSYGLLGISVVSGPGSVSEHTLGVAGRSYDEHKAGAPRVKVDRQRDGSATVTVFIESGGTFSADFTAADIPSEGRSKVRYLKATTGQDVEPAKPAEPAAEKNPQRAQHPLRPLPAHEYRAPVDVNLDELLAAIRDNHDDDESHEGLYQWCSEALCKAAQRQLR